MPYSSLLSEKLNIKPALEAAAIIVVSTSITSKNNRGDKGSPCLNPLDVEKKSVGEPLTRIAKDVEEIQ